MWFFVKEGQKFTRKDITGESIKMKGSMELDEAMRQALIDPEDGLMRPGALPKVTAATAAGGKAILDAIEKARQSWGSLVCWALKPQDLQFMKIPTSISIIKKTLHGLSKV